MTDNLNLADRYATKFALPSYEGSFLVSDDLNVRRETSRCQIFVEYRGQGLWCVIDGMGNNYAKDGKASYEPMPSNRDKEFLDQYRFSRSEALRVAARALPSLCEDFLHYSRMVVAAATEMGKLERASFHSRVVELVLLGVKEVRREFLEEEG